jgi:hypothetical protein
MTAEKSLEWKDYLELKPEHPESILRRNKTPEEMRVLEDLNKEIQEDLQKTRDKQARYKIEVTFGSKRTPLGQPQGNACTIVVYESGRRFHGGGDDLAWWCDVRDAGAGQYDKFHADTHKPGNKKLGCGKVITSDCIVNETTVGKDKQMHTVRKAVCPHCGLMWRASMMTDAIMGRWSTRRMAKKLFQLWISADGDADIYLKYHNTDIRYITMERMHGTSMARNLRGMAIYPLQNIIKDTSNGASVEDRFFIFLQQ